MKSCKYSALILNYHIGRGESIPLSVIFAFQNLARFFFSFSKEDILMS